MSTTISKLIQLSIFENNKTVSKIFNGRVFDTLMSLTALMQLPRSHLDNYLNTKYLPKILNSKKRYNTFVSKNIEIWAAGVTYKKSMEGRMEESENPDIYGLVYSSKRPELFFKSNSKRSSSPDNYIAVRKDSILNIPEPELGLVINRHGEILGFTVGNDVSSRSIEGKNPLYLPQAKVYHRSCSLGPTITLSSEIFNPFDLEINVRVERNKKIMWKEQKNSNLLNRDFLELVKYLFKEDKFPEGVILLTGTCLVPKLNFTLQPKDLTPLFSVNTLYKVVI